MKPIKRAETVGKEIRTVRPLQRFLLLDVLRDKDSRLVFYWAIAVLINGIAILLALFDRLRVVRTRWSGNQIVVEKRDDSWWQNGRNYVIGRTIFKKDR